MTKVKRFLLFTLAVIMMFSSTLIFGCGSEIRDLTDTDGDGLYDTIDPAVNDNNYEFNVSFENKTFQNDTLTVNYADFITDGKATFNQNIAKMLLGVILEGYGDKGVMTIKNNVYSNISSLASPLLVQYGCQDIEIKTIEAQKLNVDVNDTVGYIAGNHIYQEPNTKKIYQFFIFIIIGYPDGNNDWISNLDVGADSTAYTDFTGNHTEWTNKVHHKGFDVSANRIYPFIKEYITAYSDATAEKTVYVSGQSRGGCGSKSCCKKTSRRKY